MKSFRNQKKRIYNIIAYLGWNSFVFQDRVTSQHNFNLIDNMLPKLLLKISLQSRARTWFQLDGAPPYFDNNFRTTLLNGGLVQFPGRQGRQI